MSSSTTQQVDGLSDWITEAISNTAALERNAQRARRADKLAGNTKPKRNRRRNGKGRA